jgi:hypothetical protein
MKYDIFFIDVSSVGDGLGSLTSLGQNQKNVIFSFLVTAGIVLFSMLQNVSTQCQVRLFARYAGK